MSVTTPLATTILIGWTPLTEGHTAIKEDSSKCYISYTIHSTVKPKTQVSYLQGLVRFCIVKNSNINDTCLEHRIQLLNQPSDMNS